MEKFHFKVWHCLKMSNNININIMSLIRRIGWCKFHGKGERNMNDLRAFVVQRRCLLKPNCSKPSTHQWLLPQNLRVAHMSPERKEYITFKFHKNTIHKNNKSRCFRIQLIIIGCMISPNNNFSLSLLNVRYPLKIRCHTQCNITHWLIRLLSS